MAGGWDWFLAGKEKMDWRIVSFRAGGVSAAQFAELDRLCREQHMQIKTTTGWEPRVEIKEVKVKERGFYEIKVDIVERVDLLRTQHTFDGTDGHDHLVRDGRVAHTLREVLLEVMNALGLFPLPATSR